MLAIAATFPAGRYHATPWGMHVNEGAIEWPPSPWRFLRALMATGFGRLGWSSVPAEARSLFESLASTLPTYHLPEAQAAHTRHYMPLYGGNTTEVIDAFAYVGDEPLVLAYDVTLEGAERTMLDALLGAMPYLGRAESWVEARRVDAVPGGLRPCVPAETIPGPGLERVSLLAPETAGRYAAFREQAIARELGAASAASAASAAAKPDGSKPPKKGAAPARAKLEGLFPRDLIEVLRIDTPTLQKQGWSEPPGTRWVSYWRAAGALRVGPRAAPARRHGDHADTALLALSSDAVRSDVLPPMRDAVRRLGALHDALVRASDRGEAGPAIVFTGRVDGQPVPAHAHASLIPLSLGRREDRMDHVLIHAPMGLDGDARDAIARVRKTWAAGLPDIFVSLAGVGRRESFASLVPELGSSAIWRSATPFVLPRHLKAKGKDTLVGQVQAELATRALPPAKLVEVKLADGSYVDAGQLASGPLRLSLDFRHFRTARDGRPPPQSSTYALRLTFDATLRGPIALGYAAHFGLGVLRPE